MEWIKTSIKPKDHQEVLVLLQNGEIFKATYCDDVSDLPAWQSPYFDLNKGSEITHWRPIEVWISVKDRLPEKGEKVLVCLNDLRTPEKTSMHVGHRMLDGIVWIVGNNFSYDLGVVTHWMPLPLAPSQKD